jgi:hypothetical protein
MDAMDKKAADFSVKHSQNQHRPSGKRITCQKFRKTGPFKELAGPVRGERAQHGKAGVKPVRRE